MLFKNVQSNPAPLISLIRALRACCEQREEEFCQRLGLTASQFSCLAAVPNQAEELSIQQIARLMNLSPSRASRVVDSMVITGLLVRRPLQTDRRTQLVAMTAKGKKIWQAVHRLLEDCEKRLRKQMKKRQPRELEEALQSLIESWQAS